jgi:hypothetical protein
MADSSATTTLVILAALAVGVIFLAALGRRLHPVRPLGQAWDDAWACALQAARLMRTRPAILLPAAAITVLSVATWIMWHGPTPEALAAYARRSGSFFTDIFLLPVPTLIRYLGSVSAWLSASTGRPRNAELVVATVAVCVLLVTVGSWSRAAAEHEARPSARLLTWLLVPLLLLCPLTLYMFITPTRPPDPWFRAAFYLAILPSLLLFPAWKAAVQGAILVTALRAIAGLNPWSPSDVSWRMLRHWRALFWLAFWLALPSSAAALLFGLAPRWWNAHGGDVNYWLGIAMTLPFLALALAAAIIVSEGTGLLDGARLSLRAWRRAPLHLAMTVALVFVALVAVAVLVSLLARAARPLPVAVAVIPVRWAISILMTTWVPAVGLLLWQRLRDRVMA